MRLGPRCRGDDDGVDDDDAGYEHDADDGGGSDDSDFHSGYAWQTFMVRMGVAGCKCICGRW